MWATPSAAAGLPLSPALQSWLRACVRERLLGEGRKRAPWFRIQLYLRMGDAASAEAVDRDLRDSKQSSLGLIALFGQLAPGLDIQSAMARQLHLMHGCDKQLHLASPPSESRSTQIDLDSHRYSVLTMHEQADHLHRVMPCPMLVFSPVD